MMAVNKERYYVEASGSKLSADSLVSRVKQAYPDARINGIKLYEATNRSAEVSVAFSSKKDTKAKAEVPKPKDGAKPVAPQRQPGFTIFCQSLHRPGTGKI